MTEEMWEWIESQEAARAAIEAEIDSEERAFRATYEVPLLALESVFKTALARGDIGKAGCVACHVERVSEYFERLLSERSL